MKGKRRQHSADLKAKVASAAIRGVSTVQETAVKYEVHPALVAKWNREALEAIYPRPRLSNPAPEHRSYPYLLRGLAVVRPNQVWCADIAYIRMPRGFAYLVAVMDWYSRYVLAWRLSNALDAAFCLDAVADALEMGQIFNTDQGSRFTSSDFTNQLADAHVTISMDGRGRCFDNIFIERLWRSGRYEEVYLHEAEGRLERYVGFYNLERPHQGLQGSTPWALYTGHEPCLIRGSP